MIRIAGSKYCGTSESAYRIAYHPESVIPACEKKTVYKLKSTTSFSAMLNLAFKFGASLSLKLVMEK